MSKMGDFFLASDWLLGIFLTYGACGGRGLHGNKGRCQNEILETPEVRFYSMTRFKVEIYSKQKVSR